MRNKKNNSGFTLIEMLLVISILALMSSLAILTYRNHERHDYIEKVALETQNFMSASLNYLADTGAWPKNHANIDNCATTAPDEDDFIKNYVPNSSAKSLFGNYYCWSELSSEGQLFWLALKVPHNNIQLATRIAALLPNAIATADPSQAVASACDPNSKACFVRVELTNISGNSASGTYIAGMGQCRSNPKIVPGSGQDMECDYVGEIGGEPKPVQYNLYFHCPKNTHGNLIANVNYLDVGQADGRPYALRTLNFSANCTNYTGPNTANVYCPLIIDAARANGESVATGARGHVGASYVAYCVSNPKTVADSHFTY